MNTYETMQIEHAIKMLVYAAERIQQTAKASETILSMVGSDDVPEDIKLLEASIFKSRIEDSGRQILQIAQELQEVVDLRMGEND